MIILSSCHWVCSSIQYENLKNFAIIYNLGYWRKSVFQNNCSELNLYSQYSFWWNNTTYDSFDESFCHFLAAKRIDRFLTNRFFRNQIVGIKVISSLEIFSLKWAREIWKFWDNQLDSVQHLHQCASDLCLIFNSMFHVLNENYLWKYSLVKRIKLRKYWKDSTSSSLFILLSSLIYSHFLCVFFFESKQQMKRWFLENGKLFSHLLTW